MRILLISKLPLFDIGAWKIELCDRLQALGAELSILYSRSSIRDHLAGGLAVAAESPDKLRAPARHARSEAEATRSLPSLPRTLALTARERGIGVDRHRRLDDAGAIGAARASNPDLSILVGADIVPAALLAIPRLGTLNPHFGLLPRYRGMNVAEWSVYNNDPVGVSVHLVDPGIDTGDILLREQLHVQRGATLTDIRAGQRELATSMLIEAVESIENGTAAREPQAVDEGRQHYRMHPLLRERVVRRLARGEYAWLE